MSGKCPSAKKGSMYFVDYKNNKKVTPLCDLLQKISGHVKNSENAKTMCFWSKMKNYW